MGLGKSVEVISTILSNPRPRNEWNVDGEEWEFESKSRYASPATLIIAPVALIGQWVDELKKHVVHNTLDVTCYRQNRDLAGRFVPISQLLTLSGKSLLEVLQIELDLPEDERSIYEGIHVLAEYKDQQNTTESTPSPEYRRYCLEYFPNDASQWRFDPDWKLHISPLVGYADVVVMPYSVLQHMSSHVSGRVKNVLWHRIVLDESQYVRHSTSRIAGLVADLHATHRWMVTGTPFAKHLDDLHGELNFLGVWPFSLTNDGFWEARIRTPWQKKDRAVLPLLHGLGKLSSFFFAFLTCFFGLLFIL